MNIVRIPFDSFTLCAVAWELQPFIGGKIQKISQPDDFTVGLEIFAGSSGSALLILSCHPEWARAYLSTKRLGNQPSPRTFCAALRARLSGGIVTNIAQIDFDRIFEVTVDHPSGSHRLIAELMGKHSNLVLVEEPSRIVAAAKWIGKSKSSRPIQPNTTYQPPPFIAKPPLFLAQPNDDLSQFNGASPFLQKLLRADADNWQRVKEGAISGKFEPVLCPGVGAYPISVRSLGMAEFPRASICIALEQYYNLAIPEAEAESLRRQLLAQLDRVILARDTAIADLKQAEAAGGKAPYWQQVGDLLLVQGGGSPASSPLALLDFSGNPIGVNVDCELTYVENANRYFEKAKRAKRAMSEVGDQLLRLEASRQEIITFAQQVRQAERLKELRELELQAKSRRWLHVQSGANQKKEDRPYGGHRIRELLGPGGWSILYGENAEANDYLTLRVAKPNDYWLHVRGNVSAHVVVQTRNQPEKVSRETLDYAAKVAVLHSPTKHSGFVAVDFTLKKYVRRQHGAPKGAAIYTHEKTIHVES